MFCYKCGYKANDGDKFCKQCGTILYHGPVERKTIKMTCEDCNGVLEIDPNRPILSCPYCGSTKLIQESDEVVIARINKAADDERMRHEKEMKVFEEAVRLQKRKEDESDTRLSLILVISFFVFFILSIVVFVMLT